MNQVKQTNSSSNSSQKLTNFVESLRRRQQSKTDSLLGRSSDRFFPSPFSEIRKNKEIEIKRIEQFHRARSKEWAAVYSSREKQVEKRIAEIREQLKKLIKKVVKFEFNVQQAVHSEIPQPGKYHLSFLEHIRAIIELLEKNISDTNSWLSLYNQRSKKISHYWGIAKKKGSRFTLSQERQITTSIG